MTSHKSLDHIKDLVPDPDNARRHTPRGVGTVVDALHEIGAARSIVIDENDVVLAGNATVEAAGEAGIHAVRVIETDGDELIAVRRRGLTPDQKKRLAYYDNRAGEFSSWDPAQLVADTESGLSLDGLFYEDEISSLTAALSNPVAQYQPDIGLSGLYHQPLEPVPADGFLVSGPGVPTIFSPESIVEDALSYYRATGFPYRSVPVYEAKQVVNRLAAAPNESLTHTTLGYHLADTYHPQRFSVRVSNRPGGEEAARTVIEAFEDDVVLRKALAFKSDNEGFITPNPLPSKLGMMSGTGLASNFRPGFALSLYRRFCDPGAVVLDTSMGFGGRLVGFLASTAHRYIGIDPSALVVSGNAALAEDLGQSERLELYQMPAEDVPHETLAGRCDFAFTSPPYFAKEIYGDEPDQSCHRYLTPDAWRLGFLIPLLALQYAALKPGSSAVLNVADVTVSGQSVPLIQWTIDAALLCGFTHVGSEVYPLPRVPGSGERPEPDEGLLLFRKPE